ncbi:endonuclease/exonuclease/phosphatase family protein [Halorubrum vacuolatum]|uniref:Metal-dependent hydrolase, endonuclease/exonuclease/phosphatase family n=1 Tax=Halorubrum vacuolatum TaxID=63740 RepID=A0A238VPI0_HALVU|nr:endonuclease/exonuclease/phosphatase family protein [Halorubrum vacuolatum]SNR36272.1 Metal-dependent hydrolase, endonuclease/exonuclease/phosphatase family [Halorubrum vacuolatum]
MTRLRAMSYNVRYANRYDHHDVWSMRREGLTALVRFHDPDVVGLQEPLPEQRRDLEAALPGYEFVGRGRRADGTGEACPIAVRRDRWRIVDSGTFWLSDTPNEPSTGWDATHPRIATWAHVEPRGNDDGGEREVGGEREDADDGILFLTTHLDHEGERARLEGARLIRRRLPRLADGRPVVLVGDFNCTAGSPPHRALIGGSDGVEAGDPSVEPGSDGGTLVDAAAAASLRHGPRTSVTDFETLIANRRIDHVLVSPGVEVDAFATLADRDDRGRYPSDHLPVLARLRY